MGILHKLLGSSSLLYFDAVKAYFKKRLRTYSNKAIYIFTSSMANLMCPEYD